MMSELNDPRNLIVNYIPTPVTDAELRQMFEQFGEVETARIIIDRATNLPKGYGFVKFRDETSARSAAEVMNGFEIYNKRLKVTAAKGPQAQQIQNYVQKVQHLQQQHLHQQQQQQQQSHHHRHHHQQQQHHHQQHQQQQQVMVVPPPYIAQQLYMGHQHQQQQQQQPHAMITGPGGIPMMVVMQAPGAAGSMGFVTQGPPLQFLQQQQQQPQQQQGAVMPQFQHFVPQQQQQQHGAESLVSQPSLQLMSLNM